MINTATTIANNPPRPTPTPIPIWAPVLSPAPDGGFDVVEEAPDVVAAPVAFADRPEPLAVPEPVADPSPIVACKDWY